jgi:predicted nucleic acid-binding protein
MAGTWVANASPVIVLAKAGLGSLLVDLPVEVVVPAPVAAEIDAGPADDPARRFLAEGWLPHVPAPDPKPSLAAWDLGAGETAVIAVAVEGADRTALLDDDAARRCCSALGLRCVGTLGLLLYAKRCGILDAVAPALDHIAGVGLHITEDLRHTVLTRARERP